MLLRIVDGLLSSFVPICLPPLGNGIVVPFTPLDGIGLAATRADTEATGTGFGFKLFESVVCPSKERRLCILASAVTISVPADVG